MRNDDNASLAAGVAAGSSDTPQLTHVSHTPGPWGVSSSWIVCTSEARIVARCEPFPIEELNLPLRECTANAHLIAAAPDMYASLKEFAEMYADVHDMLGPSVAAKIGRLHAAIAKAEGR